MANRRSDPIAAFIATVLTAVLATGWLWVSCDHQVPYAGPTSGPAVTAPPATQALPPAPPDYVPPTRSSAAADDQAAAIAGELVRLGLPLSSIVAQEEKSDPEHKVGVPDGLLYRASFDLPGGDPRGARYTVQRGGVIHVWPNFAMAVGDGVFDSTVYAYRNGPVSILITKRVSPDLATKIGVALSSLRT